MKPTVERLTEQFTQLIGPEAFAKAEAAIAAAKTAAEAAAKAAAEKAAAAAAAAKAAAPQAAAEGGRAPGTTPAASGRAGTPLPAEPGAERSPRPTAGASGAAAPLGARPPSAVPSPAPAARPTVPAGAAAVPRPVAPPAPPPRLPVEATVHAAKGYHFDAVVAPTQVVEAAQVMADAGFALDTITGVDWIAQNEMEVVYDFFHPLEGLRTVVRTRVPRATPELPSITSVFSGANWHERETHDFFGIRFTGHPNLKPFLLPEDANFHPLRKDYQP